MVVHAAGSHGIQRGRGHLSGPKVVLAGGMTGRQVPEEGLEAHGLRELGCSAEATPLVVVLFTQLCHRSGQSVGGGQGLTG